MHDALTVLYVVSGSCWTKLFLRVFQRMLQLYLVVCSLPKLVDMMDPKYKKFSTISSASSLRVILAN